MVELACASFRDASFHRSEEDCVAVMVVVRCARNPVARQVHSVEISAQRTGAVSNANLVNALVSLVAVVCVQNMAVIIDAKSTIE